MSRSSSSSSSGLIINYKKDPIQEMEQLSRDIASSMPMRRRRFIRLIQLIKFTHQALTRLINAIQQGTSVRNIQTLLNEFINAGQKMEQNLTRILPLVGGRITREMEDDILELRSVGTNVAQQANIIIQNAGQQHFGNRSRFGGQTFSALTGNRLAGPYERITGREYPWYNYQPETYQERQARMREVQRVREQREAYLQFLDELEQEKYFNIKKNKRYEQSYAHRLNSKTTKGKPKRN